MIWQLLVCSGSIATNNNVFYKWSLLYCDKCRIERQNEALKSLPNIIKVLSEK